MNRIKARAHVITSLRNELIAVIFVRYFRLSSLRNLITACLLFDLVGCDS